MTDLHHEHERRAYWTRAMDEADDFMQRILTYPVAECGEPALSLVGAVAAAGVEVAFSDRPHVYGLPRLYLLRSGLVDRFLAAAAELNARGWVLKVEDGYRTPQMQQGLGGRPDLFRTVLAKTQWECGLTPPPLDLLHRRLGALIALSPKVGTHMSASAVDASVLDRSTGEEVDRGAPYLELSELTPMASPFISPQARRNREEITALMARHGFTAYPWEFWHYNAGDAYAEALGGTGRPGRYGAVTLDAAAGLVTPIGDPTAPLRSSEEFAALVQEALAGTGG